MAATWVQAQVHFATLYSYRVPNTSPSFAPASPVPSPLAVRLALVDAAIQTSGSVDEGRALFDLIKTAPLALVPPKGVCVVRAFVRRLKPLKPKSKEARERGEERQLTKSTGIREYCHPDGPLTIYMQSDEPERVAGLFAEMRRLGTTDSLAHCVAAIGLAPPKDLVCRPLGNVPGDLRNFERRMVVLLLDLPEGATFDDINPYGPSRRGFAYRQEFWVTPLVQEDRGENWVRYRREPFVGVA